MRDMYPARCKLNSTGMRSSMRADQRISLISSTSSNTTSGIVSDRAVHSEDEPDLAAAIPPSLPATAGSLQDKNSGTIPRKLLGEDASMMPPPPAPPASLSSRDPSSSNCSTVVVASPIPIRKQQPNGTSSPSARVALVGKLGGTTSTRSSFEFTSSHAAQNSPLDPCAELLYDGCNNKSLKYAGKIYQYIIALLYFGPHD